MSNDGVVLYFPLGEPQGATTAGNIAPGRSEVLTVTQVGTGGTLEFGAGTGPGTDDLTAPVLTPASAGNGQYLRLTPVQPLTGAPGDQVLNLECFFNTSTAADQVLCSLPYSTDHLDTGVIALRLTSAGEVVASAQAFPNATATTPSGGYANGATHHAAAKISIFGTSVIATVIVDGVPTVGTTRTWNYVTPGGAAFFPNFSYLSVGAYADGTALFTGTISHVAVSPVIITTARFAAHANAGLTGFSGEASGARIQRYVRYAGIPSAEVSVETGLSTSIAHKDTTGELPATLMQTVAETEDGVVFDGKDGTLTFHGRSHRYGATSAFTLSVAAGDVEGGLTPKLDDQHLTNDMTASRPNGVTIRSTNDASITEYGYYRETLEVLTTSDNEVQARADWEVNRFGTPRVSVPNIAVDLTTCSSTLQAALLAADIGTKFTVTGLPSQAPASTMDFFIEGISERIGTQSYQIEFNVSAAAYANVFTLDSPTLAQLDSTATLAY